MNITNSTVNIDNVNAYNNTTPIQSKVCIKCNQIKPLTEYTKNKSTSDGLESYCKSCKSIINKQYRENNRQINANKIYNENDVKQCSKCKQQKSYTEFNKCISTKSGLVSYCKDCYHYDLGGKINRELHKAIVRNIVYSK